METRRSREILAPPELQPAQDDVGIGVGAEHKSDHFGREQGRHPQKCPRFLQRAEGSPWRTRRSAEDGRSSLRLNCGSAQDDAGMVQDQTMNPGCRRARQLGVIPKCCLSILCFDLRRSCRRMNQRNTGSSENHLRR